MKTVTGKVISSEPISLSKATKLLSGFVSSDNGASQSINAYLRRASTAFNDLKNLHREIRSSSSLKETRSGSEVRHERIPRVELEEVGGDKEIDEKSEILSEAETKVEKKKKSKKKKKKEEDVVEEKLVGDEQREEESKEKKRKSDGEIGSEEKKSKKKRKSKEIDA